MLLLYDVLSFIALILYLPFITFKKGPADRPRFIRERLGLGRYETTDIWVHAVSVGEVIASVPFLKLMKREFPQKLITLSTTTYTGQNVARERFPEADRIMYMPWDTGACLHRAVRSLRPALFITVETELWPSLFRALKGRGAGIIMLNGRISHRSFRGYMRLGFAMKKVLSLVDFLFMQSSDDAGRIISIGAVPDKVGVMGNFKFDISFDPSPPLRWLDLVSGKIFLAASTHPGEEEVILDAYGTVKRSFPDLTLIIAPRHPERFDEVAALIKKRGPGFIRRTSITESGEHGIPDVIVLDTIGELARVFSKASIAFVGGSLVPRGGHNILEPAFWGKPILFGPHMENFAFAADFLQQSAAVQVKDARDISGTVLRLLNDEALSSEMGRKAKQMIEKNTGAAAKAVELVRRFLGSS